MTPSELKSYVSETGSKFFDRDTMKFYGDSMRNYGVRAKPVKVKGRICWELYRRKPVKGGIQSSAYFECDTFIRIYTHDYTIIYPCNEDESPI